MTYFDLRCLVGAARRSAWLLAREVCEELVAISQVVEDAGGLVLGLAIYRMGRSKAWLSSGGGEGGELSVWASNRVESEQARRDLYRWIW